MKCEISSFIAVILASYFCGSVPWAYIIGKTRGIDIRKHGSGNVGATNVMRVLGKKWGILCFILDFLKGAVPLLAVRILYSHGFFCADIDYLLICAAVSTVAGHVWSAFLNFKGGKGIATSAGVMLALSPLTLIAAFALWTVLFYSFRYVSLASIISAASLPFIAYLADKSGLEKISPPVLILFFILAILAIARHRGNIKKLIDGTENRFDKK